VHGFPKVMGVLTHLDGFKDNKRLKKTKKVLKHRFWAEIYQGAPPLPWLILSAQASFRQQCTSAPGLCDLLCGQAAPMLACLVLN
jgi:hypothetical protein